MTVSADRQFTRSGDWALASDGVQWVLQCRRSADKRPGRHGGWRGVSFVRSTRDILARCMREKGVPIDDAQRLLADLPATFDAWIEPARDALGAGAVRQFEEGAP
jgi:hypothetical protein